MVFLIFYSCHIFSYIQYNSKSCMLGKLYFQCQRQIIRQVIFRFLSCIYIFKQNYIKFNTKLYFLTRDLSKKGVIINANMITESEYRNISKNTRRKFVCLKTSSVNSRTQQIIVTRRTKIP